MMKMLKISTATIWTEELIWRTLFTHRKVTKTLMKIWTSVVVICTLILPRKWKQKCNKTQLFNQTSAKRNGNSKSKELRTN